MTMTNRTLVLGLVLFAAIAAGAFATLNSVVVVQRADEAAGERYQNAQKQYENTVGIVQRLADTASTVEEWKDVLAQASALPPDTDAKERLITRATIGMLEQLAAERDRLFINAGELFASNEKDPDVPKILRKAEQLQELADTFVQKLPADSKDPAWGLALQYRKAYEKYRSLAFLDPNEHDKALDIIADALSDLRGANAVSPKNNRVELAIEFLYKRAKEEESKRGDRQSAGGRPRALPSHGGRDPGPGQNGPGMGPNREQRY